MGSINILNSITAVTEKKNGLNSSEEWMWNRLFKSGGGKLSLFVFHFICSIFSWQGVTSFPLIMFLSKISNIFLSDTAELDKEGSGYGPEFWRYWTVIYHTDFSWSCGYSRLLVVIRPWLQRHFPFKWRLILQIYYFQVGIFPKILINFYGITFLLVMQYIF